MKTKKSQISLEYIVIMGFVTFIIITILGMSMLYSNSIKDRLKIIQLNNFANKVISTSESVFYSGEPSKISIKTYMPENIEEIYISENTLFASIQLSSGTSKIAFSSDVPITGNLSASSGARNIEIESGENNVNINDA